MLFVLSTSNLDAELWVFLFFFFSTWKLKKSGKLRAHQALPSDTPTLERAGRQSDYHYSGIHGHRHQMQFYDKIYLL